MEIKTVAVIGAGTMGNGIAQATAAAGYDVIMTDIKEEFCAKGIATITGSLDRMIRKGTCTEETKRVILGKIKTTVDMKAAGNAQLVIESAPEILELKANIFKELDAVCPPETILASNTSALPIGAITTAVGRKDKVIGIHFMNPVPMMKGVEVIVSTYTSIAFCKNRYRFSWASTGSARAAPRAFRAGSRSAINGRRLLIENQ